MSAAMQRIMRNRPGTAGNMGRQDRPKSAAATRMRPQSAAHAGASKGDLQRRVNQLEAMLDLQRNEYKERVERWDNLLTNPTGNKNVAKPGQLQSLEDYVQEEEQRTKKGGKKKKLLNLVVNPDGTVVSREGRKKSAVKNQKKPSRSRSPPRSPADVILTTLVKNPPRHPDRSPTLSARGKSADKSGTSAPNSARSGGNSGTSARVSLKSGTSARSGTQSPKMSGRGGSARNRSRGRSQSPGGNKENQIPFGYESFANKNTPKADISPPPVQEGEDGTIALVERPMSAAPAKNKWTPSQGASRPKTAPSNGARLADLDESTHAIQNLQTMLAKVFKENALYLHQKKDAEDTLKEFLSTTEGHQAKQIMEQREQVKFLRSRLHNMESDNRKATAKAKTAVRKAMEEEMFLKQAFREIETLREVTVELQRMNLELTESPALKLIESRLFKFQKGLSKKTKEMQEQNEEHAKTVEIIWEKVDEVNKKVDGLYAMTQKLKEERAEAGKLLKVGKERIKECRQTLQQLTEDFYHLKKKAHDSASNYERLVKRQDEESQKVAALKLKYKEILEELIGNNKWYKKLNADLEEENKLLKRENTELLESLMAYLMLNQQSRFTKGKAKQALDPLAKMADKKRIPEPVEEEKDSEDEGKPEPSLATKEYPLAEPVDLPQPPDPEFMSPRVLVEQKKMPLLLGEIVDVQA